MDKRQGMLDRLELHYRVIQSLDDEDLPYNETTRIFYCTQYDNEPNEEGICEPSESLSLDKVRRIMRKLKALGATVTKQYNNYNFTTTCTFESGAIYQLSIERNVVCEKKVVATEWVPPSKGYTRDIVEWVCDDLPVLSGE